MQEYFLVFEHFSWFKDASIAAINNVECQGRDTFYWPELDVDFGFVVGDNKEPRKFSLYVEFQFKGL